jgi:solute carrier family 25 (adenine nucleotide translocator) protein 4/5/6/31
MQRPTGTPPPPLHTPTATQLFLADFAGGFISQAISKTVTAPTEKVKLVLQTQSENPNVLIRYNGFFDCLIRLIQEDGVLSLFDGNIANVVRYIPTQLLNFTLKDTIRYYSAVSRNQNSYWKWFAANLLSGGVAGAISLLAVYPIDYARTRLAADVGPVKQFNGYWDCIAKTVKKDGIDALYVYSLLYYTY